MKTEKRYQLVEEEEEEEEVVVGELPPTGMKMGGKVQGKNARLDESLGERRGPERDFKQSMKDRRDESRGARKPSMRAASDKATRGVGAVAKSRPWANSA